MLGLEVFEEKEEGGVGWGDGREVKRWGVQVGMGVQKGV